VRPPLNQGFPIKSSARSLVIGDVQGNNSPCGPRFKDRIIKVGATGGVSKHVQEQLCGAGEAGFALETRYGKHVNAIGLRCRPLEAPVAPQEATTFLSAIRFASGTN
jgi:hypothetical protein